MKKTDSIRALAAVLATLPLGGTLAAEPPSQTNAYFGAVHVHTYYSFDAYTNGTLAFPAQAYQWPQGEAIPGGGGGPELKIRQPLDLYAVSDHAEWLGVFKLMEASGSAISKHPLALLITSPDPNTAMQAFAGLLRDYSSGKRDPSLEDPAISASVWSEIAATADEYYRSGEFTTFPAFEWSANPDMRNLHRVVLFRDTKNLPDLVLSSMESTDPEVLWEWMGEQRGRGATLLAIPHNGNASDGLMFSLQTADGKLPAVGNTVDVAAASYANSIGAPELSALWRDPDFDASQHAFYYARVLEIPTPRWSTYDAKTLGMEVPGGLPTSIQERAFSSPVRYRPSAAAIAKR